MTDKLLLTSKEAHIAGDIKRKDGEDWGEYQARRETKVAQTQLSKARTHYTKLMEKEYERGRKDEREKFREWIKQFSKGAHLDETGYYWHYEIRDEDIQALKEGEK